MGTPCTCQFILKQTFKTYEQLNVHTCNEPKVRVVDSVFLIVNIITSGWIKISYFYLFFVERLWICLFMILE